MANKALAELKGAARSIPNQTILINALTLQEAKAVIFHYIEMCYNSKRYHSYLDYLFPNEFEIRYYLKLKNLEVSSNA